MKNEVYTDYENRHLKDHLYGWIFHYNIYRKRWEAVKREYYNELFSGDKGHVVKANTITTLVEVINKKINERSRIN